MHKQTRKLKIADPIGFPDRCKFTEKINTVANSTTVAPQPLDRFNPIRAGEMRLIDLQLIDTFTASKRLGLGRSDRSETMKTEQKQRIYLSLRLVQPARIHFEWLPAEDTSLDQCDQEHFTPICGWIVPNKLNGELIYSTSGMGSIETSGKWIYAPSSNERGSRKNF